MGILLLSSDPVPFKAILSVCSYQEQMYTEQLQQHESLLEEAHRTSFQHAQTVGQLEALDNNRRTVEASAENFKIELIKTKVSYIINLTLSERNVIF